MSMVRLALCLVFSLCPVVVAEDRAAPSDSPPASSSEEASSLPLLPGRTEFEATVNTRVSARTMTLSIPAPRGLITDRNGHVFANNRMAYHLALQYPELEKPSDQQIIEWARKRTALASKLGGQEWTISDRALLNHYKHRRWLPLQFKVLFEQKAVSKLSARLMQGLTFHPFYIRNYPKAQSAAHIIGYVRSQGKLPVGPINHGDALWEKTYGAEGLEKLYDPQLVGLAGTRKIVIDSDGTRLKDEFTQRPEVGDTLVLTLDARWQKRAETTLARHAKKGALVLLDIQSGEVLTLASYPSYDINVWVPSISQTSFDRLRGDEDAPMFARAYQARYPPASTFKSVVAASALTSGAYHAESKVNCPAKIKIGNKFFHNHTKRPDGYLNARKALARSNNCWFYQVGLKIGPEDFLSTARQLGFGSKTGLPLFNETAGLVPTDEYMLKTHGRSFTDGDTANLSIGQGSLAASPLQVAQSMAGLASGHQLPRLRLIKQIQTHGGSVIDAPARESRNALSLSQEAIEQVHKGMYQVVHAPYGTGKKAALSFTQMTGKTGTAQWIQGKELAWFAGFFPYENPRFAYAVLYEGSRGESVSGGAKAAPIIRSFLNSISSDLLEYMNSAAVVAEIAEVPQDDASVQALKALPVEE